MDFTNHVKFFFIFFRESSFILWFFVKGRCFQLLGFFKAQVVWIQLPTNTFVSIWQHLHLFRSIEQAFCFLWQLASMRQFGKIDEVIKQIGRCVVGFMFPDFFTKNVLVYLLHQHLDLLKLAIWNATLLEYLHGNVVQLCVHLILIFFLCN